MTYRDDFDEQYDASGTARSAEVTTIALPALTTAATPCLEPRRIILEITPAVDDYTKLLPAAELRAIVTELHRACDPAPEPQVKKLARLLVGSYPQRGPENPDIYARWLVYDLKEFPADIIKQTVHHIRRTHKFFPAIAEIYEVSSGLMLKRRHMLRIAEAMLTEHERRDGARRAEEEARREAEERELRRHEDLAQLQAAVEEAFGDDAPRPGDYELALKELRHDEAVLEFDRSYRALEPWAIERCRRLATQRRARDAGQAVKIDTSERASGKLPADADPYMLAANELREQGADANEIEAFTVSVMENYPNAQAQCAELAKAARDRVAARLPKKRGAGWQSAGKAARETEAVAPRTAA